MQDAGRDIPAGANFEPVRCRKIRDFVIALFKVQQGLAYLRFRDTGLQTEERVWKITAVVIRLRREIIRLRLAQLPRQRRMLVPMMNMMRQSALIVEEL